MLKQPTKRKTRIRPSNPEIGEAHARRIGWYKKKNPRRTTNREKLTAKDNEFWEHNRRRPSTFDRPMSTATKERLLSEVEEDWDIIRSCGKKSIPRKFNVSALRTWRIMFAAEIGMSEKGATRADREFLRQLAMRAINALEKERNGNPDLEISSQIDYMMKTRAYVYNPEGTRLTGTPSDSFDARVSAWKRKKKWKPSTKKERS
jgi:hypothetical protein